MRYYSKRELYALGETLGDSITEHKVGGGRIYGGGGKGGGGGGPTQTTSTSNVSNIPEYAQPYVETMLGATQKQLFNMDDSGNITGFSPYKAYGGTYDASGNQTSYDPSKAIAGFSPMQQQAQQGIANMQLPGTYGAGIGMTGNAAMQSGRLAGQEANAGNQLAYNSTDPNAMASYMNPYIQNALNPALQLSNQQYGMKGAQEQGAATSAGAFGGSRNALMQGLNQQNQMLANNQLIGNAYNQAYTGAQNQMNTVAQTGLAGQQAAMQGIGQQGAMANQLAGIGGQALQAQQGIYGLQNQSGAAQQAQQQQIINQAMTDYSNAQQYPLMQLGTMSNMLRGLPMQASTTNQYVAAPNAITQGIGLAGAGASIYNALGSGSSTGKKAGGIVGYNVGGSVRHDLYEMEPDEIQDYIKTSASPSAKKMAEEILRDKVGKAGGGIIAFASGSEDAIKEDPAAVAKAYRDAAVMNSFKQEPKPYVDRSIVQAAPTLTRDDVRASEDRIANKVTEDPAMVRQAQIDAALLQSGNQNMPKNLQFTPGVTDRAQFMNPDSAAAKAITNKNLAGTGLNMDDEIAKQLLNRQLAESSAQRKGPQAKTFADLPPDQQKAFFAALEGKTNPKSIVAAAPPSVSSGNPTGAVAGANGTFNAADPANANKNVAINPNASAPAPARVAAPGQANLNAAPSDKIMPTSGIKLPANSGLPPGLEAPTDPDANKSIAQLAAEKAAYMGPNTGNQDARAQMMAERANAKDEARRVSSLRMAEFFGAWGSTPGNTIVAGLNALKNKIPDFISDIKEESKIRRQIDKDISELDKIDRLEKSGNWDEAAKRKTALSKNAVDTWATKVRAYSDAQHTAATREVGLAKAGEGGGGTAAKNLNQAITRYQTEDKNIAAEKKGDGEYKLAVAKLSAKPDDAKSLEIKNKKEAGWNDRLAALKEDVDYYKKKQGRETGPSEPAPNAKAAPGSAGNPIVLK